MIMKTADGEHVDFSVIFHRIGLWFEAEMRALLRQWPSQNGGLLLGVALWGDTYIQRFDRFCLPSMLSAANAAAMRGSALVVFTDRAGTNPLSSLVKTLEPHGINVLVFCIPDDIMSELPGHWMNKFWILGAVHNMAMKMAARLGMGFHTLYPDHVYSKDYFPNLDRLSKTHEAIAQTSISADIDAAGPGIEAYKQPDGSIAIPARDLGAIGWKHLHQQMRPMMMTGRDIEAEMPRTSWFGYRGRDVLAIYSAHMNPAYMSPRLCTHAPTRMPATMDSELPLIMPEFYVPKASDGLTFIELSDGGKLAHPSNLDFNGFAENFWNILKWSDPYLDFLRARGEVPIPEQPDGQSIEDIERQHNAMLDRLVDGQERAALRFVRFTLDMGR